MVAVVLIGSGSIGYVLWNRQNTTPSVVTQQGDDPQFDSEDGLARVPTNAKSETCSRISAKAVEKALGYKTNGAKVSIPTKKTADATVSACAYVAQQKDKAIFSSVVITSRTFAQAGKAQESLDVLRKSATKTTRTLDNRHLYDPSIHQIVAVGNNSLFTLTYTQNSTGALDEKIVRNLAALLK